LFANEIKHIDFLFVSALLTPSKKL